jgi:hypothetical protein
MLLILSLLPGCRPEPPAPPYFAAATVEDPGQDGLLIVFDAVTDDVHHVEVGTGLEFVREHSEQSNWKVVMRATTGPDRGRLFRMKRAQITASRPSP